MIVALVCWNVFLASLTLMAWNYFRVVLENGVAFDWEQMLKLYWQVHDVYQQIGGIYVAAVFIGCFWAIITS